MSRSLSDDSQPICVSSGDSQIIKKIPGTIVVGMLVSGRGG